MTGSTPIFEVLGWRGRYPNIADRGSATSVALATAVFEQLGVVEESTDAPQTLGSRLEMTVRGMLTEQLPDLSPATRYQVGSHQITDFAQYAHLARMEEILDEVDTDGTIRAELGTDYIIRPDVTVGILSGDGPPFLHAAISCKWTIRSDRVQNIRHEGIVLTRHRRGRQPHVVTVTAEPLPSRLAAIARGTGEVDCVYHALLSELAEAVRSYGGESRTILEQLMGQGRLLPLDRLPDILINY